MKGVRMGGEAETVYYPLFQLFQHMFYNHKLILTDRELVDIVEIVKKMEGNDE